MNRIIKILSPSSNVPTPVSYENQFKTEMVESGLLRINIADICNYSCCFCCWKNISHESDKIRLLPVEYYRTLAKALVCSGNYAAHLTGGEPLAVDRSVLCQIVSAFALQDGINEFYITTNGSLLDREFSNMLFQSGLRDLHVSIGAETNIKYSKYTNVANKKINLDFIFKRLKYVSSLGISVRVDIPVCRQGICTFKQMKLLIEQALEIGVRRFRYFRLHKTTENKEFYDQLYSPCMIQDIRNGFKLDPQWRRAIRNGVEIFTDLEGHLEVIGDKPINAVTDNCKVRHLGCKEYCQGTYAIYFISQPSRIFFRGCHHQFENRVNEYEIPVKVFDQNNISQLTEILNQAWKWAVRI